MVRRHWAGLVLVALLAVACGGEPPATEEPRTGEGTETGATEARSSASSGRLVDGYYTAEGAPDPLACASDDECTYGGVLGGDGCCWSYRDMNAAPMSVAYRDWSLARRGATCGSVDCPPPPVPTEPPDCLFTVRCADGRCVNACP